MNRRELMAAMSIFPFVGIGKKKIKLDRIRAMSFIAHEEVMNPRLDMPDMYFPPRVIKDMIKKYNEVTLEDEDKNILKVNKLNKGLVLLKLDLIK